MNKQFKDKSLRLQNWDYGSNGYYFVTICTKNEYPYFGEIKDQKMILSSIGNLALKYWNEIPQHFPFVHVGEFIVMPDHVHGIININKTNYDSPMVGTQNFAYLPLGKRNKFGPQSKNLASIVRGYKIGVTKNAKRFDLNFKWQPSYYDVVLRSKKSISIVSDYIRNNPKNWKN